MAGMEATWWLNDHLAGVAGREERGRHAHPVRAPQRHLGDGAGAARRRRRDPPAPGGGRLPGGGRRRRLPGASCPTLDGGPEALDAIQAFLDRYGMRCVGEIDITRPRWSERPSTLVPVILGNVRNFEPGAGRAPLRAGTPGGAGEGAGRAGAAAGPARRRAEGRRDQADDRPGPDLRRVPRVPEVRDGLPLLRLQAGAAGGGRPAGAGRRARRAGGRLLPLVRRAPRRGAPGPGRRRPHRSSARRRSRPTRRSRRRGCSPPTARSSPGPTDATTCPTARWSGLAVSAGTIEGRARVVLDIAVADLEAGRHPRHRLHRPQLDAPLRRRSPAW